MNAIHENLIQQLCLLPTAEVVWRAGWVRIDAGVPSDLHNAICQVDPEADLAEPIHHFRKRGFPFSIWREDPAGSIIGMQHTLNSLPAYNHAIESVTDLTAFAELQASQSDSPELTRWTYRQLGQHPVNQDFYVGYIDDQPIATGRLCRTETTAGLYDLLTTPAARHQGWAHAMVAHLLAHADRPLAVLQTTEPLVPFYEELGFVQTCRFSRQTQH